MQSIEARAVAVVNVILRVLLVLPHVLFLAYAFKEAPSVKYRAKLMYPRGIGGCAYRRI
jgi:TRAP-type mannitol/chloroaromatic compound transport system permease small subunit